MESLIEAVALGDTGEPRPIHGDLSLGHVLIDGDRVGLIDFDMLLAGDPLRDLASFATHLAKTRSRAKKRHDQAGATLHACLDEYFAHVPEQWRARFS